MSKKFLVGVANIYAYNKNTNDLYFASKTMLDTAIEVSTSNQEISGGQGNALQFIYFHSPRLNLTLTDTQFNLGMIAANVGSAIKTSNNVWDEESVVITGNAGAVLKIPVKTPDSKMPIYGWVTDASGNTQRVTFTGKNFTTVGLSDQTVCVRYYNLDAGSRQVEIPANFVPANVRLVMECQLASSNQSSGVGSSIIGKVQFEINSAQLSGAQSIAMSSSGVANTPLSAMALADDTGVAGCSASGSGLYGKITEIIYDAKWYDALRDIVAVPNPVSLSTTKTTEQLQVWAIPMSGASFIVPDYSELTFTSGTPATATVNTSGLITRVGTGSSVVTVSITAKPEFDTTVNVVSA